MVDYTFYTGTYLGNSIPKEDFARVAAHAHAQLGRYKRAYTVEGSLQEQDMAVCAMADAIYYFENVANGAVSSSSSVGSVSSSTTLPDCSPTAQAAELLRCVKLYLRVYRGVGRC